MKISLFPMFDQAIPVSEFRTLRAGIIVVKDDLAKHVTFVQSRSLYRRLADFMDNITSSEKVYNDVPHNGVLLVYRVDFDESVSFRDQEIQLKAKVGEMVHDFISQGYRVSSIFSRSAVKWKPSMWVGMAIDEVDEEGNELPARLRRRVYVGMRNTEGTRIITGVFDQEFEAEEFLNQSVEYRAGMNPSSMDFLYNDGKRSLEWFSLFGKGKVLAKTSFALLNGRK